MMIDKKGVDEVIDILQPDAFYKEAHRHIFEAIVQLFTDTQPIDLLTVSAQLRRNAKLDLAGGDFYLIQLTQKISSSAHIEFHSRIILQKFIQRSLIKISSEIIEESYDETTDVFDLLDKAESKLYEVTQGNIKRSSETAQSLVIQAKKRIEEIAGKEGLSGIATGFEKLDKITSGWQPSDLIIIAARPGMGKTAMVLSVARNASLLSEQPRAIAIFSLEMSNKQLVTRMISGESEIPGEKLRKGTLAPHEWEQLNTKVARLSEAPIFIDDTPALSVFELRSKCRRLKEQNNIEMIIIDYLQLMRGDDSNNKNGNREQEVSYISRSLKALAKELDVPVIALAQLSRASEKRGAAAIPMLSDLRESGSIEQDADMVMFIYRPEYYGITEFEDGGSTHGVAELHIAKHRNGSLDSLRLRFVHEFTKFKDLEEHDFGGTDAPSFSNDEMGGFGSMGTITRSSKLNDMSQDDDEFTPPPF
jgi:replicative DNA helicase